MSDTTPATLSPEELEAIRQRAAKATPGPWKFDPENYGEYRWPGFGLLTDVDCTLGVTVHAWLPGAGPSHHANEHAEADAGFIANARKDVGSLLAHAAALTRDLEAAREENVRLLARDCTMWRASCKCGGFYRAPNGACPKCGSYGELVKPLDVVEDNGRLRRTLSPPPSPPPGTESPAASPYLRDELRQMRYVVNAQKALFNCGSETPGWFRQIDHTLSRIESLAAPTPVAVTPAPAGEAGKGATGISTASHGVLPGSDPGTVALLALRRAVESLPESVRPSLVLTLLEAMQPARQDAAAEKGDHR